MKTSIHKSSVQKSSLLKNCILFRIMLRAAAFTCVASVLLPNIIRAQAAPQPPQQQPTSQQQPLPPQPPLSSNASNAALDEIVIMSPFTVTTTHDRGYLATNSTAGTRLDTPIKELPMPIEVITGEFIQDTGATDLRQSLRYSSGILLQTQNDYGAPAGSFSLSPGKVNSPEGLTASPDQTHMKIRGFDADSVLRDGFRRQNSTDSINIARVEVARGPASLLYGVGNFGGVVNYLVKTPDFKKPGAEFTFGAGSYDFFRGTLDLTGPIPITAAAGKLAYRLTGAAESAGSYTDFNRQKHFFVSPVIEWRPFPNTSILLDVEYGRQNFSGIGWQRLRAAVSGFVNDSAGYNGDFYQLPGKDVRAFRWSGPDTYRNTRANNIEFKISQRLAPGLFLLAGVNYSTFNYAQLDNLAAFQTVDAGSNVPPWAVAPVLYAGIVPTQDGVPAQPTPSTIAYQWEHRDRQDMHVQPRVELTYTLKLFQDRSPWLRMNHQFLLGYTYTRETSNYQTRQTPGDVAQYHSPADTNYFRYGHQPDGTPDHPLVEWDNHKSATADPAAYAVYQGRFLDDRITLIAGARRDRSWNNTWTLDPEYNSDGTPRGSTTPATVQSTASKDTTYQYGVSIAVLRELSLYAMHSEGIQPNYQGKLDFYGRPLVAALAKNNEYGIKFKLFDGRLSGTISRFEITRTRTQVGDSSNVWSAPVVAGKLNFDPAKPIVYQVNDMNPANNTGPATTDPATVAKWNAAVTAGAIYQATNSTGATNWYVNASTQAGADYMDTLFAKVADYNYNWWGWLYNGSDPGSKPFDNLVNNATMDDNGAQNSVATGSDRARGWDAQIIISPIDDLQILLSWSHIEKTVLSAAQWAKYPHPQDRWAIWYAPYTFAATAGRPLNEVYADPADTSTYIAFGTGLPMDDTPKNQGTFWVNYNLPKKTPLKGLSIGLGGYYESSRVIYPAYGQNALDIHGNQIFLSTPSRVSYNAMLKYAFKYRRHPVSVQLNIDNLLNDRKLYGWVYAAPISWKLTLSLAL